MSRRLATTLAALAITAAPAAAHDRPVVVRAPDPGPSHHDVASCYGMCADGSTDGEIGTPSATGQTLRPDSPWVAGRSWELGRHITVYYRGRHVCALVNDTGGFEPLGRHWDLGPGVAIPLGFSGVQTVGWRWGCGTASRRVIVPHCHGIQLADGRRVRRCARTWPQRPTWRYLP